MFRRFVRLHCKNLKTLYFSLVKEELPVAGVAKFEMCVVIHFLHADGQPAIGILLNWSLKIQNEMPIPFEYELGWTAFLASGIPQKWISRGKRLKNDSKFHQTGHLKFKMGCLLPFENELGWTAFLVSWTSQNGISREKKKWKMTFKVNQLTFNM